MKVWVLDLTTWSECQMPQKSVARNLLLLVAALLPCFAPAECAAGDASSSSAPASMGSLGYAQHTMYGVKTLQQWYSQSSGLYASPSGWWNSANAITVLANYERVAGDASYYSVLANTFTQAQHGPSGHPNFRNSYYDDQGWWALAWIDAYDLTANAQYLSMAETIFANMTNGWDTTTCGGGIWWSTARKYKNAIANELFLTVAAKLANRTSGSTSATYLRWAQREWTWFRASGMINSKSLINDGLNSTSPNACVNNNRTQWTYNQGVILGALVELHKADSDPALLPQAQAIATAVLSPSSGLVNSNGVLVEHVVSGKDTPQFKGIFLRNLMALYGATPNPQYKSFADTNANSIWANDRNADYQFGALWQGPFDSADATRQTSALDALISAAAMQ
jgi:predicted alpha-1,6-mannanase (GH76 family)